MWYKATIHAKTNTFDGCSHLEFSKRAFKNIPFRHRKVFKSELNPSCTTLNAASGKDKTVLRVCRRKKREVARAERVELSFETNLLVGRAGRNAVHWIHPTRLVDWSDAFGTGGCYANVMLRRLFSSRGRNKNKSSRLRHVSEAAAAMGRSEITGAYHDGSVNIYQHPNRTKGANRTGRSDGPLVHGCVCFGTEIGTSWAHGHGILAVSVAPLCPQRWSLWEWDWIKSLFGSKLKDSHPFVHFQSLLLPELDIGQSAAR